ncbi:MAG: EamA family transporter [Burkholderiaceae bacterium]|nr:EamA family transporter [Burkholderiaceae bacterium]
MPTRLPSWQLFAVAVLIWGTTWHAILYQLAVWPPEYGVALRFGLAALTVFGVALWRGDRLRLPAGQQRRVAVQGIFMYGLAYLCVYHGERHVPSGLVAVGYATSPLLAGLGAWALWRSPLTLRFGAGGLLGVLGVALIFAPELATVDRSPTAGTGLAYTVGAVLLSAVGALSASRNAHHGLPFWPTVAWGLAWGAGTAGAAALLTVPLPQAWPTAASWWLSLAYLAVAGTVVAFGAFLTLQHRLGPAKASTIGVMTPVVALVVSAVFEGFRPGPMTLASAGLTVLGNVLMLRR